ncbi:hypothetical protein EVAR_18788_1 [Eumeta japonica]|uniref:Uncharacterized protein n=1 Tax=Eumeta variegata TaxID=151549 RepID=A0A4C1UMJ2_EUMVA|nr:hypothetical protein EVAR_18788_1 [Eumeta japonica]
MCGSSSLPLEKNEDNYLETIFDVFTKEMFDLDETDAEKVHFSEGQWVCGQCARRHELALLHNETEFLNTKQPIELQLNVAVEGSKCVTLAGRGGARRLYGVAEVSGLCKHDVTYFFVRQRRAGVLDLLVHIYG